MRNVETDKPKVCIIDDSFLIRSTLSQCLKDNADCAVGEYSRIPEDESELAQYDVLIVDGQGIGNSKFKKGFDFLKAYKPTGRNIGLIYHSGFISGEEERECISLGVECIEKGGDHDFLVQTVKGFFK